MTERQVGPSILNCITLEDFETLRKAVENAVTNGTPYKMELRSMRKDGEIRVCHASGFAERGSNGKPVRLFGLLHDITEHKRAEEALFESEKLYRNLVDTMAEGVVLIERNGQIVHANPQQSISWGLSVLKLKVVIISVQIGRSSVLMEALCLWRRWLVPLR